jgi:hypothetical protein
MTPINKKLGYYTVDSLEFDSKIRACLYASCENKEVQWHFNNKCFENYDWSVEPDYTLDQLYDKRTRELREQYDYIIISYSGGADSHNIVASFIRQNLHIDEIIVNTMKQLTDKSTILDCNVKNAENAAAEYDLQTVPRLKEISAQCPKTKISVLDMSDYLLKSWLEIGNASWIMDKREGLNPLNVTRFNYIHFNKVRKQFDKSKSIALILGVEKPRTTIGPDNKFFISFSDRATNIVTIAEHVKEYTNSTVEYFYWSPQGADIVCKQSHVIKQWLEQDTSRWPLWDRNCNNNVYRLYHERILRPLIYTTWKDEWYQADKATKDWYSEFDSWFINGHNGTTQHRIWLDGIVYMQKHAKKFVSNHNGINDGLLVFAHHYFVDYMKDYAR